MTSTHDPAISRPIQRFREASRMRVPQTIAIEFETIGDSRSMFRLRVDGRVVGENLTAAQTHILVGDILEEIALPKMEWMVRREVGLGKNN